MLSKKHAIVDIKHCVSCGSCVKECLLGAINVWKGCYAKVQEERCVGCGKCAKACPVGCIEILPRETANET